MQGTTLYKIPQPEQYISDYYEIAFFRRPGIEEVYTYIEYHGWWNEDQRTPIHNRSTISAEEGVSLEEAEEWYEKQIKHRAREGFIYAFSPNPFGDGPTVVHDHA
jgi:hypothetical protein